MSQKHGAKGPAYRAPLAKAAIKPPRRLLRMNRPIFEKKDYDGNAGEEAT